MKEAQVCGTKQIYSQLSNVLQFRLSRILEYFFIAEINELEKMNKVLNNFITALGYTDKTSCSIWYKLWDFSFLVSYRSWYTSWHGKS